MSNEPLSSSDRSRLRGLAQALKPAVTIGKAGLTPPVIKELEFNLERHELIKVRLPELERDQRAELLHQLCDTVGATLCGAVGHTASIYRYSKSAEQHVM
ncbi:MAG: YhbY family RNA-binding protein [Verrucomicrobiota bacterium JB022]|nr:YhbY family RNA-binding protein [Verrucomicrobiota bacterium JB022]